MTTLFEFPSGSPSAQSMRTAANDAGISFDPTTIVAIGSQYLGFGAVSPSELSQTETDNLTSQIESSTGQQIAGPYTLQEALDRQYPAL